MLVFFLAVALVAALPPSYRAQVGLQSMNLAAAASSSAASSSGALADDDGRFAPGETVRYDRAALALALPSGASAFEEPSATPLTESERLRRMSRLYRYQASLTEARAAGDEAQTGRVLDQALREMQALARRPGLWKDAQFQRVYGHLAEAYRRHYGAPDTLRAPRGEIFATRDSLFAAVERARVEAAAFGLSDAPLLSQSGTEALAPQNTEVGMPVNDLTRGALRYLQREPEDHVYRWMRRKETYFPMIEHIFAEEGVPDELKYLALVESGLNPQAESRADAAGIWQFIPETGRAYGLKITPWVDERLDPEKATRAAAAHLKDLYRMFDGDWHLALSGYNCSPTRIREALRRVRREGKRPTFWNIYPYIPHETRNYVPTYVAAALMLSNPGHFDLESVQPGPRYRFDRVPVKGMLPLTTAADLAGTTVKKLRALNPSLRRRAPALYRTVHAAAAVPHVRAVFRRLRAAPRLRKRPDAGASRARRRDARRHRRALRRVPRFFEKGQRPLLQQHHRRRQPHHSRHGFPPRNDGPNGCERRAAAAPRAVQLAHAPSAGR
jgi:hypothetical protein